MVVQTKLCTAAKGMRWVGKRKGPGTECCPTCSEAGDRRRNQQGPWEGAASEIEANQGQEHLAAKRRTCTEKLSPVVLGVHGTLRGDDSSFCGGGGVKESMVRLRSRENEKES